MNQATEVNRSARLGLVVLGVINYIKNQRYRSIYDHKVFTNAYSRYKQMAFRHTKSDVFFATKHRDAW